MKGKNMKFAILLLITINVSDVVASMYYQTCVSIVNDNTHPTMLPTRKNLDSLCDSVSRYPESFELVHSLISDDVPAGDYRDHPITFLREHKYEVIRGIMLVGTGISVEWLSKSHGQIDQDMYPHIRPCYRKHVRSHLKNGRNIPYDNRSGNLQFTMCLIKNSFEEIMRE